MTYTGEGITMDYPTTTLEDGTLMCVVCERTEHDGHDWDCPIGMSL